MEYAELTPREQAAVVPFLVMIAANRAIFTGKTSAPASVHARRGTVAQGNADAQLTSYAPPGSGDSTSTSTDHA